MDTCCITTGWSKSIAEGSRKIRMLRLREGTKIYVANQSVDGRKAINRLSACMEDIFPISPKRMRCMYFITNIKPR